MAAIRVIPCLDIDAGRVVKGVNFENLRDAGDPATLAAAYNADGADEIALLDITASKDDRETLIEVVRAVARQVSVPLTVGGGVRSVADVSRLLAAGATKVGVNTAAVERPALIAEVAKEYGASVLMLSLDARRTPSGTGTASGFEVTTRGGKVGTRLDAVEWAQRAVGLGVGEVLLNSMDADGTEAGFDLEMLRQVRAAVAVPLIASGGAGAASDFVAAAEAGADAVLGASVFHFGKVRIAEVKAALQAAGFEVS